MFNEARKEKFQDLLKMDKNMIAYHNQDNLRKLIMPNSLKQCEGIENSANYHADKAGIKKVEKIHWHVKKSQ